MCAASQYRQPIKLRFIVKHSLLSLSVLQKCQHKVSLHWITTQSYERKWSTPTAVFVCIQNHIEWNASKPWRYSGIKVCVRSNKVRSCSWSSRLRGWGGVEGGAVCHGSSHNGPSWNCLLWWNTATSNVCFSELCFRLFKIRTYVKCI